jgi:hypothetical protein
MYDITASIVTYQNPLEDVVMAVASVLNTPLRIKLYIVDNSPTDLFRKLCSDSRIEYIFNTGNLGFGGGHNIAIRKALNDTRYHLILNPDVFFERPALERLIDFMEDNPRVGLVMPKICYPDGNIQYLCKLLPAPCDLSLRRINSSLLNFFFRRRLHRYELRFTGYNTRMDVPYLSGCFMLVRSEVFKNVGMFDERFFIYLEDVDFCRRVTKMYRNVYYPEVVVQHRYNAGSYKDFTLLRYHICSAVRYFNKWGWVFDRERVRINKAALAALNANHQQL